VQIDIAAAGFVKEAANSNEEYREAAENVEAVKDALDRPLLATPG
jgi:hypothetical protein